MVDASHIDAKKKGVMDIRETAVPLARFLCRKEFKEKREGKGKPLAVLFY